LGGRRKVVYNTDDLLNIFPQNGIRITGGKTGYTPSAGYCFVGKFVDHEGREMISVVLGSASRDSRFSETKELVEWAYKVTNYKSDYEFTNIQKTN
jgi:D-alanyl-D-alanine carboxypeptidase (penicillin-binding protein 5/6)